MKTKKQILALALTAVFVLSLIHAAPQQKVQAAAGSDEIRGVWVSMMDFEPLGLKDKSKAAFKKSVKTFLKTAKKYKTNAIFLHVRANDDAFWPSNTFPAMTYLSSKATPSKKASKVYAYDPLELFIDCADDYNMEVHAYLNPYRITNEKYLDPSLAASRKRIKKAVRELLDYDIAGIHFDDYFYHATQGYVNPANPDSIYPVNISAAEKRNNVNKLVRSIYTLVHGEDLVFGISPQGNYVNDMNSGADVRTWLANSGYVDYVAPQLYWSDGSASTYYSERLDQFLRLRKGSVKLYAGLALYKADGTGKAGDSGWGERRTNLRDQVALERSSGGNGYILFSGRFFNDTKMQQELSNLKSYLNE